MLRTDNFADIQHAYHALALDEHRAPFSPSLWHFPASKDHSPPNPAKDVEQLWSDWEKIYKSSSATKKQLEDAWGAVVDGEMYEHLQGNK